MGGGGLGQCVVEYYSSAAKKENSFIKPYSSYYIVLYLLHIILISVLSKK